MSHPHEYTFPVDVLPDDVDPAELSPAEQAQAWHQEITELGHLLPYDSSAKYALDTLRTTAATWPQEAQRVADKEANDIPTTLQDKYDGYRKQAQRAPAEHANRAAIGGVSAPINRQYPTAQMMDGTISQQIPPNMFEGLFASPLQQSPRQAAVSRAHQQTAHIAQGRYEHHMSDFFDTSVQPAVERAIAANPTETSQKIVETLAQQTDTRMSPALEKLREAILHRNQSDIGATALYGRSSADRIVIEATNDLRNALHIPSLYTQELKDVVGKTLQEAFGLPGEQQIAQRMAETADYTRDEMTRRLFQQVARMVAQHRQGIDWMQMDVTPEQPKPQHEQEVDAEIEQMRAAGVPDGKINRRLMMRYHPEGSESHPQKAKYVSDLITATKPKQETPLQ